MYKFDALTCARDAMFVLELFVYFRNRSYIRLMHRHLCRPVTRFYVRLRVYCYLYVCAAGLQPIRTFLFHANKLADRVLGIL